MITQMSDGVPHAVIDGVMYAAYFGLFVSIRVPAYHRWNPAMMGITAVTTIVHAVDFMEDHPLLAYFQLVVVCALVTAWWYRRRHPGTSILARINLWYLARHPHRLGRGRLGLPWGLTLTEIRAEYTATILRDAGDDPALAEVLGGLSDMLLKDVRRIELEAEEPVPAGYLPLVRYAILTGLANGHLARITEPGAHICESPYRPYSEPMLLLAAACQLGVDSRLRVSAT